MRACLIFWEGQYFSSGHSSHYYTLSGHSTHFQVGGDNPKVEGGDPANLVCKTKPYFTLILTFSNKVNGEKCN